MRSTCEIQQIPQNAPEKYIPDLKSVVFLKLLSVVFPVIRHGSHDTLKAFQPQVLLGNAFEENVFGILLKYLQERQNAFS